MVKDNYFLEETEKNLKIYFKTIFKIYADIVVQTIEKHANSRSFPNIPLTGNTSLYMF